MCRLDFFNLERAVSLQGMPHSVQQQATENKAVCQPALLMLAKPGGGEQALQFGCFRGSVVRPPLTWLASQGSAVVLAWKR